MVTGHSSVQQQDSTSGPDPGPGREAGRRRRELLAWIVLALLPVSVLTGLLVLHDMVATSAAATGGCGGG